ncbi:MAG: magnesium transporter [Candidatus Omnitrophota bacterium]
MEKERSRDQKRMKNLRDMAQGLENLLEKDSDKDIRDFLRQIEPEDVAEMLGEFSNDDKLRIFNLLDAENAAVVLDDTDSETRSQILQKVNSDRLAGVFDRMPADEAADIIEEVSKKEREDLLDLMKEEDAEEIEELLSYPEDSAGRVMNPEFVYVREDGDVEDAIGHIRGLKTDEEFLYVYVVAEAMKFRGVVPIRKLLTSPKGTLIKDIMENSIGPVSGKEDQEKVALIMKKYDFFSLPVVDDKNRLVGRITIDDIIDVVDEERGEDISRMTGTIEEEQGTETTLKATRNRLPWLVTCMLGSIVTGLVIRMFEITLAETIALVSFIPVITATGGNSGVQASTVVVREMALGHMRHVRVFEEVWRQLKIALGLGIVCAGVLTILANLWMKNSLVGMIVGLSLFLVVVWSNFVGVVTPVLFKKIRIDPAIASGPLITTLNDVIGVFIYLSIASSFLR